MKTVVGTKTCTDWKLKQIHINEVNGVLLETSNNFILMDNCIPLFPVYIFLNMSCWCIYLSLLLIHIVFYVTHRKPVKRISLKICSQESLPSDPPSCSSILLCPRDAVTLRCLHPHRTVQPLFHTLLRQLTLFFYTTACSSSFGFILLLMDFKIPVGSLSESVCVYLCMFALGSFSSR